MATTSYDRLPVVYRWRPYGNGDRGGAFRGRLRFDRPRPGPGGPQGPHDMMALLINLTAIAVGVFIVLSVRGT